MPSFRFSTPDIDPLTTFETLPRLAKAEIARGIKLLCKLPEQEYEGVAEMILQALEGGVPLTLVATKFKIERAQASAFMSAGAILVTSGRSSRPVQEIVAALVSTKLLDAQDGPTIERFLSVVSTNASLKEGVTRAEVASATLPALTDLAISVDLRLKLEEGRIVDAVPVAIIHADTDTKEELWAQMSKRRLQNLVKQLQDALEEMERADQAAKKLLS